MERAVINKIIPFSSVDGPGNRTVIFFQGCPFECKYCHNPETIHRCINCGHCVSYCKTEALTISDGRVQFDSSKCVQCDECIHNCPNMASPKTREYTVSEIIALIKKNMPFVRGITVSGGECTMWRDFIYELFVKARELGLGTLIDSNGSYDFSKDSKLLEVTDGVMLDIKAWNEDEHSRLTGISNTMVLNNLKFLAGAGKLSEVRTVIVPELINADETIANTASFLRDLKLTNVRMKIIKYRVNGVRNEFRDITPPTDEYLNKLRDTAVSYGLTDVVII